MACTRPDHRHRPTTDAILKTRPDPNTGDRFGARRCCPGCSIRITHPTGAAIDRCSSILDSGFESVARLVLIYVKGARQRSPGASGSCQKVSSRACCEATVPDPRGTRYGRTENPGSIARYPMLTQFTALSLSGIRHATSKITDGRGARGAGPAEGVTHRYPPQLHHRYVKVKPVDTVLRPPIAPAASCLHDLLFRGLTSIARSRLERRRHRSRTNAG